MKSKKQIESLLIRGETVVIGGECLMLDPRRPCNLMKKSFRKKIEKIEKELFSLSSTIEDEKLGK